MPKPVVPVVAALAALLLILWAVDPGERADEPMPSGDASDDAAGRPPSEGPSSDTTADAIAPPGLQGRPAPAPPSPAPDADPGSRVTGQVVDASGVGVAKARVLSLPARHYGTFTLAQAETEGFAGYRARTDPAGRFAVGVSGNAPTHQLFAVAEGLGIGGVSAVAPGAEVTIVLEPAISLEGRVLDSDRHPVAGARVRALLLVDAMAYEREATTSAAGRCRVDDLPPALATGPEPGSGLPASVWFEVTAAGFAPLLVEDFPDVPQGGAWRMDFTLSRGATLTGRITDAERGTPLAGATVVLYSTEGMQGARRTAGGGGYSNPYAPWVLGRAVSAADGFFSFEHVPSKGAHGSASHSLLPGGGTALGSLVAWKPGFASDGARVAVPEDGTTVEANLGLWPAAVITGRVVEADGTPVAGAIVAGRVEGRGHEVWIPPVLGEEVPGTYGTSSEGTGRFCIAGVPAARGGPTAIELVATPPHPEQAAGLSRRRRAQASAEVAAGEHTDVGDLVLPAVVRFPTTTFVVRTDTGEPYLGATITRCDQLDFTVLRPLRTDAEGRAAWAWRHRSEGPTPTPVKVIVRAPGFAPEPVTIRPPGPDGDTVEVVLRPGRRIAGRVLASDGSSAAAAWVYVADGRERLEDVFPAGEHPLLDPRLCGPGDRTLPLAYGQTRTNESGAFAVEDLPDGPYHLYAAVAPRAAGGRPVAARLAGVAADREDVVLELPPDESPPVGTVVGRVAPLGGGRATGHRYVRLLGADGNVAATGRISEADEESFRLERIPEGTYRLVVFVEGYRPERRGRVEVEAGRTTDVGTIELSRGIVLRGRVEAPAGANLEGRRLRFRREGDGGFRLVYGTISEDGRYRATGLEPGRHRIAADAQRSGSDERLYLLRQDDERLVIDGDEEEVETDLVLVIAGTLVLSPTDERLPKAPFAVTRPTAEQRRFGEAARVTVTDAKGRVVAEKVGLVRGLSNPWSRPRLLPGRYVARLELPGGDVSEETIDLEAGARVVVRFE